MSIPDSRSPLPFDFPVIAHEIWPNKVNLPLGAAMSRLGLGAKRETFEALIAGYYKIQEMKPAPILAVMGSMNGGKSSCVASLLTPAGAARVPRGIGSMDATNRFVFWLPKMWDDRASGAEFWGSIESQLAGVFGPGIEFLSDIAEEARSQYVGADAMAEKFDLPLIAFDERLNELNLCLLDCPDVESKTGDQRAKQRLEVVERSAGLIHGVLYLVDTADVRSEALSNLADVLNSTLVSRPKFLLLNKIRTSHSPVEKRIADSDVVRMQETLGASAVFAAYDFEASSNAALHPANAAAAAGLAETFPWFFRVGATSQDNIADGITPDRMLPAHLDTIQGAALWEKTIHDKQIQIRSTLAKARQALREKYRSHRSELMQRRDELIRFLKSQMTDREQNLKIPFTATLLKQISESFMRSAPFYAKPSLMIKGRVSAFTSFVEARWDSIQRTWRMIDKPAGTISDEARIAVEERLRAQKGKALFQPADFVTMARDRGIDFGAAADSQLEIAFGKALVTMQVMTDDLSDDALDAVTLEVWKAIPAWKKALLAAAAPVLAVSGLIAVCFALVDLGVSAVVFSSSTAHLLGLLGAGGAAAIAGTAAAARLDDLLRSHVAVPAFCRAVAATCDVFGLPREIDGPVDLGLPGIQTAGIDISKLPPVPCEVPLSDCILAEEIPEGWTQLDATILETPK